MFSLTREVRFAIQPDGTLSLPGINAFAGNPPLSGLGYFFCLRVCVTGDLDPVSGYLLNIRRIDEAARQIALPLIAEAIRRETFAQGVPVVRRIFDALADAWPEARLRRIELDLSPFLALAVDAKEPSMVRLNYRFEFSAAHRLASRDLSDAENFATFGKCSNPHGHGHNYELQVSLTGRPDPSGTLVSIPELERIVQETVLDHFDHKNLNVEVPEFGELIPSVENIAMVIYKRLRPRFGAESVRLASVTVWETPKTFAEYCED